MAMIRSALARIPRRLLATAAIPRGTEILQAPALPFLHPVAPSIPRPGPAAQMIRTFTSPAAPPAASAVRIRDFSNVPGQEPVGPKGTMNMDQIKKKAAEFIESARCKARAWLNRADPRLENAAIAVTGVASFVSLPLTYHRIGRNKGKRALFAARDD